MSIKLIRLRNSRNFYLRGTVRGRSVFETTGTSDEAAAEEIRIKREAQLLHESIHGKRLSKTFAEAAEAYLSAPGASENVERFILPLDEHFGHRMLHEITQDALDAYVRVRCAGRSPATILRNVVTPMTAVMNFAARRKWCDPVKFDRPPEPTGRKRWATQEEANALLSAASPHLRILVFALLYTGARMSELLDLEWRDIDLERRWAVFRDTKTGSDRGVPLHPALAAELQSVKAERANLRKIRELDETFVFLSDLGTRYRDADRQMGGQIKTAWRGACVRAGLARWEAAPGKFRNRRFAWVADRIVPHDLRHTTSTWLLMAGVDHRTRDEILGHAAGSMGARYAHVPVARLFEAIDKLPPVKIVCEKSVKGAKLVRKPVIGDAAIIQAESTDCGVVGATGIEPVTPPV